MAHDRLVTMANQIGTFFSSQKHSDPVAQIADHLSKFWDPRMRANIIAYMRDGGDGLLPQVRQAVATLKAPDTA